MVLFEYDFGGGIFERVSYGGENFVFGVEYFCDVKIGEDEVGIGFFGEVE